MAEMPKSAAQQDANAHAAMTLHAYATQRSALQRLLDIRPGVCAVGGQGLSQQILDGDFALDEPLLQGLLHGPQAGPVLRAAPRPAAPPASRDAGAGALDALGRYLVPNEPAAAPGTARRVREELHSGVYGPTNIAANSTAALAGGLRALAERDIAGKLREGLESITSGRANRVVLSAHLELYNAAPARRPPRVRLRVRRLPLPVLQSAVPTLGGPQNQWRPNPSVGAHTLKARAMSDARVTQVAALAADHGLPPWLRWTQGRMVGGVLTFAPSAALDLYNAASVDLEAREFSFDGRRFAVDSARSQSGNLVGFAGGAIAVVLVGATSLVGAPVLLIGLGAGIAAQVAWNSFGGADWAAGQARRALD